MKKKNIILLKAIVFVVVLIAVNSILSGIAAGKVSYRSNKTLSDFYNTSEDITTVFVGPSLMYYGVNPYYYDLLTGENAFVLGTQSQRIDLSYYLIKEIIRTKKVKKIVLETYTLTQNGVTPEDSLLGVYYSMPISINKVAMTNNFDYLSLQDLLFPLSDTHSFIFEQQDNENTMLYFKGFWGNYKSLDSHIRVQTEQYAGERKVSSKTLQTVKNIIALCKNNNIQLEFVSTPFIEYKSKDINVKAISEINNYLEDELGIRIHNYSYDMEKLGLTPAHFCDTHHLNYSGSYIYTIALAKDLGGDKNKLKQVDDFNLLSVKSRGWYNELLVNEEYGKGYEIRKSSLNKASDVSIMFFIQLLDDKPTKKGKYEFSVVLKFDQAVDVKALDAFVCSINPEDVISKNVTKLDNGYYKVSLITSMNPKEADLDSYFYLSKSIEVNSRVSVYNAKLTFLE